MATKYMLKPVLKKSRIIQICWQVITLLYVNFSWVIFNSASLKSGLRYCLSMLGIYVHRFSWDVTMQYYFREYGIYIVLGILFSMPIMRTFRKKIRNSAAAAVYDVAELLIIGFIFLWAVSFVIIGARNPFIYFNF